MRKGHPTQGAQSADCRHACAQAYKNYITKIVTRKNSITGVAYSADPAVFAWELANEPRTSQGYEDALGLPRGSLIRAWVGEMAAFIRSLDSHHMVGLVPCFPIRKRPWSTSWTAACPSTHAHHPHACRWLSSPLMPDRRQQKLHLNIQ